MWCSATKGSRSPVLICKPGFILAVLIYSAELSRASHLLANKRHAVYEMHLHSAEENQIFFPSFRVILGTNS